MQIITAYAPPTYSKPCIVFSTLAHETAVCFSESPTAQGAIQNIYEKTSPKTGFLVIKKHKTPEDAAVYHNKIALKYRNGESEKIWRKGFKDYLKLVEKFSKEIKEAGIDI